MTASTDKYPGTHTLSPDWSLADYSSSRGFSGPERLEGYVRESSHWYTDETGRKLFRIDRYRSPLGRKEMDTVYGLGSKPYLKRVLYRLPEVRKAVLEGRLIYLCEGEKDVETLEAHGLTATTAPYGAAHWDNAYTEQLRGAYLCIVIDNDEPGWARLDMLIRELEPVVRTGRVVKPAAGLKDATDHFAAGYGLSDFEEVRDA